MTRSFWTILVNRLPLLLVLLAFASPQDGEAQRRAARGAEDAAELSTAGGSMTRGHKSPTGAPDLQQSILAQGANLAQFVAQVTDLLDLPDCAPADRRCPHEFSLTDMGYLAVDVVGDFKPDGWQTGVPMFLSGGTWATETTIPWMTTVQYKFRINGGAAFIPDPDNPDWVDDGFGGFNSVLAASSCLPWICEPGPPGAFDWRDAILYSVMVDRFRNGDPSNDGPIGVDFATDWQGGDWAGVTQAIQEGYFDELGVNCLLLSAPMDGAQGSEQRDDGHDESAYHGQWPYDLGQPEEHFGTLAELRGLVDAAHERGIKVMIDYVMNHVHDSAPVYSANPGWFWPLGNCLCGYGCSWDGAEGRMCWFKTYLPDFNFTDPVARDFSVTNTIQWILDTGVDGLRLDAVKHIELAWLLDLRARIGAEIEPITEQDFYLLGQTFTGDSAFINGFISPSMLDGQLDFPLRSAVVDTVLMRNGQLSDLAGFMDANDEAYGAGIMATFLGMNALPRAIHLAEEPPVWDDPWASGQDLAWSGIALPTGSAAFERMALGFTLLLTTPGAPLIDQGDEIGMPGAGDPDNRRFMQWAGHSVGQLTLLDHVKKLTAVRGANPALRRGERSTLSADADTLVYELSHQGERVYVAINRADSSGVATGLPAGAYEDLLSGQVVTGPGVLLAARTSMVLVLR